MRLETRSLLSVGLMVCMGLWAGVPTLAQSAQDDGTQQAMQILQRLQDAARTLDYEGTFAHQREGQMRGFKVTHRYSDGQEQERLEVLTSRPLEFLRHNDQVQHVMPHQQVIVTERRQHERFPALFMDVDQDLTEFYQPILHPESSRVAGHECQPLSLIPKDEHRIRYDLCVDLRSGLLLEAQTRDQSGALLEHIAFYQVQVGQSITDEQLRSVWASPDWPVVDYAASAIDFDALGWFYREPPGYHVVSELERRLYDGRMVQQLILTDGLATISIFIEPYQPNLSHHQMAGAQQSGAVSLFGRQYGAYWVMVVGEAPASTIRQLARSIVKTGILHHK